MTNKEVFYQVEGASKIESINVDLELKLTELRKKICEKHSLDAEINIFLEDEESPLDLDFDVKKLDVKETIKIHANRCREVRVVVTYNGKDVKRMFAPSTTVSKVHEWATIEEFGMDKKDASELFLALSENSANTPKPNIHIGTLVNFPQDQIHFYLNSKERING